MNYIFLDEIQHVASFERAVGSLFLKENCDVYITGSNAYFLSSELATVLSGRYVELKMLPLSFKEYYAGLEKAGLAATTLDEATLARELAPFKKINDNFPKYLLTLDELFGSANYNGIQKKNVPEWLLS